MFYEHGRVFYNTPESYTSSVTLIRSDYSIATMLYFIAGWNVLGSVSGGEASNSIRPFRLSSGKPRYDIQVRFRMDCIFLNG